MDNYLIMNERIHCKMLELNERIHRKMLELLEEVEETNQGEVIFSDRAKTIIEEIANLSENLKFILFIDSSFRNERDNIGKNLIFQHYAHRREIFEKNIGETTPSIMYGYILNRIMYSPTRECMILSVVLLVPILNKLLKKNKKVFLGGTCKGFDWRSIIIPKLQCDYYNPIVENWSEEDRKREVKERENAGIIVYTITNDIAGVYSIAEVVDDSNKRARKVIFCNLYQPQKDKDEMYTSLKAVEKLLESNGVTVCRDISSLVRTVNKKAKMVSEEE